MPVNPNYSCKRGRDSRRLYRKPEVIARDEIYPKYSRDQIDCDSGSEKRASREARRALRKSRASLESGELARMFKEKSEEAEGLDKELAQELSAPVLNSNSEMKSLAILPLFIIANPFLPLHTLLM